jgi:hypothetical protein
MTYCQVYLFGIFLYNWFYKDKLKKLRKKICLNYLEETEKV